MVASLQTGGDVFDPKVRQTYAHRRRGRDRRRSQRQRARPNRPRRRAGRQPDDDLRHHHDHRPEGRFSTRRPRPTAWSSASSARNCRSFRWARTATSASILRCSPRSTPPSGTTTLQNTGVTIAQYFATGRRRSRWRGTTRRCMRRSRRSRTTPCSRPSRMISKNRPRRMRRSLFRTSRAISIRS